MDLTIKFYYLIIVPSIHGSSHGNRMHEDHASDVCKHDKCRLAPALCTYKDTKKISVRHQLSCKWWARKKGNSAVSALDRLQASASTDGHVISKEQPLSVSHNDMWLACGVRGQFIHLSVLSRCTAICVLVWRVRVDWHVTCATNLFTCQCYHDALRSAY